jgi:hypothetical protein
MDRLKDWLLDRMTAYHGGGVPWREAARWTYGELLASYRGRHWTRGKPTRAPAIPAGEALEYARKALGAIRGVYEGG